MIGKTNAATIIGSGGGGSIFANGRSGGNGGNGGNGLVVLVEIF